MPPVLLDPAEIVKKPISRKKTSVKTSSSKGASTDKLKIRLHNAPSRFGETVTVSVGPEGTKFCVHKDLLTATSDFFRRAFAPGSSWIENQENAMTLEDVDEESFYCFTNWLYTQSASAETIGADDEWMPLARAMVLSERLLSYDFQNHLSDIALEKHYEAKEMDRSTAIIAAADLIYNFTPSSSRLRKLFRSMWVSNAGSKDVGDIACAPSPLNRDLLQDFLILLLSHRVVSNSEQPGSGSKKFTQCELYHTHLYGSESGCPRNVGKVLHQKDRTDVQGGNGKKHAANVLPENEH